MANAFASFMQGQQAGQQTRQVQQQQEDRNAWRSIAPQILAGDPNAVSQGAVINPQGTDALQATGDAQLRRAKGAADYFSKARQSGNPEAVQTAFKTISPFMSQVTGKPAPDAYDEATMGPAFDQFVASIDSRLAGAPATGGDVLKSLRIGADGNFYAIQGGQLVNTGIKADPRTQLRDQPGIAPSIIDLRTGSASPLKEAGSQGQPFTVDPSLPPEVQAQIRASEASGQPYSGGQQLIAPRQNPSQIITPYQQAQLGGQMRDDARADAAFNLQAQAAAQALSDRQAAAQEKQISQQRAVQGVLDSTDDALSTIQQLRSHPGYRSLGTVQGDAATALPLIRTDAKGAQARLETVKSQALINTLSALKQASSTGASGFGSLTEKEGAALQASMANLTTAQTHEDLDDALGRIETILRRNQSRAMDSLQQRGGFAPPQAPQRAPVANGNRETMPAPAGRTAVRTGTLNGRKVVQYSDGSTDYAD